MRFRQQQFLAASCLALCLAVSGGCLVTGVKWKRPKLAHSIPTLFAKCGLQEIEACYSRARKLERDCCAECVDRYFEVAMKSAVAHRATPDGTSKSATRLAYLQHSANIKLISAGQEFGRLHPATGLKVCLAGEAFEIPIDRRGFVWKAVDFDRLDPVGDYWTNSLWCSHRCPGVGIPLVVTNTGQRSSTYVTEGACFSATLVVDVASEMDQCVGLAEAARRCKLTLYDPLRIDRVQVCGKPKPLAKDLSAPLAFRLKNERTSALDAFLQSEQVEGEGQLRMLEPYQPDKVPVVLIHGLLSNPFTWVQLVNELMADPSFRKRFQIWTFTYPTGQPFVLNAAELRSQLSEVAQRYALEGEENYLSEVVLIGHSLGGLVAKLQIADSKDRLWRSIANRDFDSVVFPPGRDSVIRDAFFFRPSPQVSRVIFIGTPHGGSNYARRLVGRLGSALVRPSPRNEDLHQQLLACNPGVFTEEITRGIPTSIAMMEPQSCLLQAIRCLPVNPRVQMHSVIGDCHWSLTPGDGVVPVENAQLPGTRSELYVDGKHGDLNKIPESIQEVRRILALHLAELRPQVPSAHKMHSGVARELPTPEDATSAELHWREIAPASEFEPTKAPAIQSDPGRLPASETDDVTSPPQPPEQVLKPAAVEAQHTESPAAPGLESEKDAAVGAPILL